MVKNALINYVVFQAGWIGCVWGAASGRPWLGLLVVASGVVMHLLMARQPGREAALLLVCAAVGLVFESALLWSGWVAYPNGSWLPGVAPYWMIALWILFGTTLNLSMRSLRSRPWLSAVLGAIGGPVSYLAGEELGAISLLQPTPALVTLALGWALMLPPLFRLAARFDGFAEPRRAGLVQASWREVRESSHV